MSQCHSNRDRSEHRTRWVSRQGRKGLSLKLAYPRARDGHRQRDHHCRAALLLRGRPLPASTPHPSRYMCCGLRSRLNVRGPSQPERRVGWFRMQAQDEDRGSSRTADCRKRLSAMFAILREGPIFEPVEHRNIDGVCFNLHRSGNPRFPAIATCRFDARLAYAASTAANVFSRYSRASVSVDSPLHLPTARNSTSGPATARFSIDDGTCVLHSWFTECHCHACRAL